MGAPEHCLPLGDGWHLWKDVELRGAGFPAARLFDLGAPDAARRAEEWLRLEAAERASHERLIADVQQALARAGDEEQRRALRAALSKVRKRRPFEAPGEELAPPLRAWEESRASLAEAWAALEDSHGEALRRTSEATRAAARDERLREALLWQNRAAFDRLDSLLASDAANAETPRRERLVASYLQRYCARNDRIGFFGPHAWAQLAGDGPALAMRPGPALLARRIVRLEAWAIDALADRLAPELRPGLAPRIMPSVRLEEGTLHHSVDRTAELPPAYVALLAACDGRTSARRIAAALVADGSLDLAREDEVLDMLAQLADRRVVVWTLDAPTSGGRPEELLRRELDRLEPGTSRDGAVAALAELEGARDEVGRAAGAPERLHAALRGLDETFARLTGAEPSRRAGQTHAGRTLVFEMCHRDVEVRFGPALWQPIAPALRLLLQGARWFTHEIAARYRSALLALYRRLRGDGDLRVDYLRLAAHLPELFPGGEQAGSIVDDVRRKLRARWRQVIGFDAGERRVRRSAGDLGAAASDAFAAPGPGWPAARHQSIDLLIAAPDADAVERGEHLAVLGEVHPGLNTLLIPDLPHAYETDVLFERRDREIGRPCAAPVRSRSRTHLDYYSRSPGDFEVEHGPERAWRPRDQVLAAADLIVEEERGALWVRSRSRPIAFEIVAFLEHHLIAESHQQFSLVGGDDHAPRIEIDGLVASRERWSAAPADVDFAWIDEPLLRFVRARAWAARLGLPRAIFVRTPEEVKPTYVDLDSPIYVDLAARLVRAASAVSFSEMLPALDQCWLADAEGRRYSSELRLTAVDPEAWTPPGPGLP